MRVLFCSFFCYCEIVVSDAKKNEKLIEELKSGMQVQEETMEKQDQVIQKREEEIQQLGFGEKWFSCFRPRVAASTRLLREIHCRCRCRSVCKAAGHREGGESGCSAENQGGRAKMRDVGTRQGQGCAGVSGM